AAPQSGPAPGGAQPGPAPGRPPERSGVGAALPAPLRAWRGGPSVPPAASAGILPPGVAQRRAARGGDSCPPPAGPDPSTTRVGPPEGRPAAAPRQPAALLGGPPQRGGRRHRSQPGTRGPPGWPEMPAPASGDRQETGAAPPAGRPRAYNGLKIDGWRHLPCNLLIQPHPSRQGTGGSGTLSWDREPPAWSCWSRSSFWLPARWPSAGWAPGCTTGAA